jgi:predicted nucleic acid-binding protein
MINVAVDTNVFIASLIEKDIFHADAIDFIGQIEAGKYRAHISRIVVVEIAGAISRRTDSEFAREAIEIIGAWVAEGRIKTYNLNSERMIRAYGLAIERKLKGMDAIVLQVADELKIPFKSYDEEMKNKIEGFFDVL